MKINPPIKFYFVSEIELYQLVRAIQLMTFIFMKFLYLQKRRNLQYIF